VSKSHAPYSTVWTNCKQIFQIIYSTALGHDAIVAIVAILVFKELAR
jgi:hypothetical protein